MIQWLKNQFTKRSLENPSTPLNTLIGVPTLSGVAINEHSAMRYSTVWACVNRLSSDIASLKFGVYERKPGGGKQPAINNPINALLTHSPDGDRPAFKFWQTAASHLLRYGNAYVEIERNGGGFPIKLHLLPPDRMYVDIILGKIRYELFGVDNPRTIRPINILHFAGLGYDGIVGYSPIAMARESIGIGLSADLTMAAFYGLSAKPAGVLQHPGKLSADAKATLREDWEILTSGPTNAGRTAILQEGITWNPKTLPAPDQAFLLSRQWQPEEICRWYLLPPTKAGIYEHATYSNLEQSNLDYLSTVIPWANSIVGEMHHKLFLGKDRERFFIKPHYQELLKCDTVSKNAWIATGRQWGTLSADECRDADDLNPLPDGQGQIYLSPANMVTTEALANQPAPSTDGTAGDLASATKVPLNGAQLQAIIQLVEQCAGGLLPRDSALAMLSNFFGLTKDQASEVMGSVGTSIQAMPAEAPPKLEAEKDADAPLVQPNKSDDEAKDAVRSVLADSLGRIIRREIVAIRRASKKPNFGEWLGEFYAEHRSMMSESIRPAVKAYSVVCGVENDTDVFTADWIEASQNELGELTNAIASNELPHAVDDLMTRWEKNRVEGAICKM